MTGHVHVIGAGLAGLSATLALTARGRAVTVYEAGPAAGGRCRSYFDRELGLTVDNGNHMLLSGNRATMRYLDPFGGRSMMARPDEPTFPFIDLANKQRWAVRPNRGLLPWWVFSRGRRVPGTKPTNYLALLRILRTRGDTTVYDALRQQALYRLLIAPLTVSALNTQPESALTRLLAAVLRETLMKGGESCLPMFPRNGLSAALIDPAVAMATGRGAAFHFGRRIAALRIVGGRVAGLAGPDGPITLGAEDAVVLAVPAWVAADLLPGLMVPVVFGPI